jgi:hypothetical protein
VPTAMVPLIVERKSNWRPCAASPERRCRTHTVNGRGCPSTRRYGPLQYQSNVASGGRCVAWLIKRFHNDPVSQLLQQLIFGKKGLKKKSKKGTEKAM